MKRSLLLSWLAPVVVAGSLHGAAADYLLEIDGIKGESSDDRHAQSIEIEGFSWGATNTTNSASSGGGGGAGKVSFQDMHFVAKATKATPKLFLACATGQHYPRATLFVRKAGASPSQLEEYYTIVLEDVLVTSLNQAGPVRSSATGDVVPTDQFSLNFGRVTLSHTGLDGTVTTATVTRTPPQ